MNRTLLPLALLALVLADGAATGRYAWSSELTALLGSGVLGRAVFFLAGLAALSLPGIAVAAISRAQARRRERRAQEQASSAPVELTLGREKA